MATLVFLTLSVCKLLWCVFVYVATSPGCLAHSVALTILYTITLKTTEQKLGHTCFDTNLLRKNNRKFGAEAQPLICTIDQCFSTFLASSPG